MIGNLKGYLLVLFCFTCANCVAQVNLVQNPSFEIYSLCPDNSDEIKYAIHWMSLDSLWSPPDWFHDNSGVPEYLNICGTGLGAIPTNGAYYNYPHNGFGMAEVQMLSVDDTAYERDYLQGHLNHALVAGQSYCVTFYVAMEQGSLWAINHIGAYLDNGSIDTTNNHRHPHPEITPQVLSSAIIADTVHFPNPYWSWKGKWVKIQGSFVANGSERIITIANFSDSAHTSVLPFYDTSLPGGGYTWYLVDDVCVMKSNATINAGPDKVIPIATSDSVVIGDTLDSYLPTYWYANGVLIDSNKAWLKVHPDITTTYVVGLERCSGDIVYDTVKVWVGKLEVPENRQGYGMVKLWPNPVVNELRLTDAMGASFGIYDLMGRELCRKDVMNYDEIINVSGLRAGVYLAHLVFPDGSRQTIKLLKE